MRKNIVAGNWKMNNDLPQTEALITDLLKQTKTSNAEVMIAPTAVNLYQAFNATRASNIEVIAKTCTLQTMEHTQAKLVQQC